MQLRLLQSIIKTKLFFFPSDITLKDVAPEKNTLENTVISEPGDRETNQHGVA